MNFKGIIIIVSIVSVLVLSIGLTYAWFIARIEGTGASMTVETKELIIEFVDTNVINETNVEPGWDTSKTFTVENKTTENFTYDIYIDNLLNFFETTGYLQYKLVSDNNGYTMTDFKDIPMSSIATNTKITNNITIAGQTKQTYTLYLQYPNDSEFDQSDDMGKIFSGTLAIKPGTSITRCENSPNTLECKVLADNPSILERSDFNVVFTQTNTGRLYKTNKTEDNSDVYYFAGDAKNNWVVFGTETKSNVTYDICWRIIRTNTNLEGNGLRLLYSGVYDSSTQECGNTTSGTIGNAIYGSPNTDPSFVGYMRTDADDLNPDRGNSTSSPVKTAIDTWYNTKTNLPSLKEDYINTKAIYCADRSISSGKYDTSTNFYFGAYGRIASNKAPSLKCGANASIGLYENTQSLADKFTASIYNDSKGNQVGNGLLTGTGVAPFALMTTDEVLFAGGKISTSLTAPYAWYFKNKNNTGVATTDSIVGDSWWWLLSPFRFNSGIAGVFYVRGSAGPGALGDNNVAGSSGLRPAVSLTSDVLYTSGSGAYNNPYRVN